MRRAIGARFHRHSFPFRFLFATSGWFLHGLHVWKLTRRPIYAGPIFRCEIDARCGAVTSHVNIVNLADATCEQRRATA